MLIQVDVDSTLYDADKLFGDLAEEQGVKWPRRDYGWKSPEEIFKADGSPCAREDLTRIFRKAHSREVVLKNKPYPHAVKVLKGIAEDYPEVEIAYVSDRNEQQGESLRAWLEQEGFLSNPDQHVAATKDKRHWMRERKPEIVIDDRVRTMLMARFELGSYVVSLQHNHNINIKGEVEGIEIVKDWKAIDAVLREEFLPELLGESLSRAKELAAAGR